MTEEEWRKLGVRQFRGWVHYIIHRPGCMFINILLLNLMFLYHITRTSHPPLSLHQAKLKLHNNNNYVTDDLQEQADYHIAICIPLESMQT